jgi:sulfur-carrier protein adenylyltransferase/sulfurtransferase
MNSSNTLYERYSRQVSLKEFGEAGQQKLLHAKVLMIGAGGLGCAALQYMVAAGIGNIGIIDNDVVSLSNLHRQVLYSVNDIGLSKAGRAASILHQLNPDIIIDAFNERLTVANALELLSGYNIIIDGTDNFSSRYMINDACCLLHKPLIYGAVSRFEGQVAIFNCSLNSKEAAVNYRDLFPQPPADGEVANCAEAGVLGVLPGIIGAMQANEAIKLITGIGSPLINKLLTYNALHSQVFELQLAARSGTRDIIPKDAAAFKQTDYDWLCGITANSFEINDQTFNALRAKENVLIIDVREYGELPDVHEFEHTHIPLVNISTAFTDTKNDTIIVFCQSGKRSLQAAKLLAGNFGNAKKIFSLGGGILKWKQQPS